MENLMKKFYLVCLTFILLLSSNLFSQELPKYYLQNSIGWYNNDSIYGAGFKAEFGTKVFKGNYLGLSLDRSMNADEQNKWNGDMLHKIHKSYFSLGINLKRFFLNQRILTGIGIYDVAMLKHTRYTDTSGEEPEILSDKFKFVYKNPSLSLSGNIALFKTENFSNGIDFQALLGKYKIYNIGYFIRF